MNYPSHIFPINHADVLIYNREHINILVHIMHREE